LSGPPAGPTAAAPAFIESDEFLMSLAVQATWMLPADLSKIAQQRNQEVNGWATLPKHAYGPSRYRRRAAVRVERRSASEPGVPFVAGTRSRSAEKRQELEARGWHSEA